MIKKATDVHVQAIGFMMRVGAAGNDCLAQVQPVPWEIQPQILWNKNSASLGFLSLIARWSFPILISTKAEFFILTLSSFFKKLACIWRSENPHDGSSNKHWKYLITSYIILLCHSFDRLWTDANLIFFEIEFVLALQAPSGGNLNFQLMPD